MTSVSYYSSDVHGPQKVFHAGKLPLESGETLRSAQISYVTRGELSAKKDNAILFPTWYSGSTKILEQAYVGPGRALDPEKYFIILVNQIGNGLSSSPHNTAAPFNAVRFPTISIADDVRVQRRLIAEQFGIDSLALVLGGSMGAQQTYEWAVRYPEVVKRAAPIAGTAKRTHHNALLVDGFIEAIISDPGWQDGWYGSAGAVHRGLRRHARLFATSGFTPALFNREVWRDAGFSSVEDFLVGFVEGHFVPQDPNNLLTLLRKWRDADVSRASGGDLEAAFAKVLAKVFVIAIEEDGFFPIGEIEREQALIPGSELKRISSEWGHLALFGLDDAYNRAIDAHLNELLSLPAAPAKRNARPTRQPEAAQP
jgi:homoserine O-acetyltransferase